MKIGVIGGGQLGRMMALAGTPLGMQFAFLDPAPDACAQALGEHIRADYGDQEHLRQLADDGYIVVKFFVHMTKQGQKKRLTRLHDDPATSWRVSEDKLARRHPVAG